MIEPLANPQILPGKAASPGHPPQLGSSTPASVNSGEQTVTVAPGNPLRSLTGSQSNWGSISSSPRKLLLLLGAGTATLVIAVSAISANRQPPLAPAATQNRAEITPSQSQPEQDKSQPEQDKSQPEQDKSKSEQDKSKSEQKKSCIVVLDSSNVRSKSGRSRTGQVIKAGTAVTVTGKEEDGWIEITSPVSGWIWKSRTKSTNTCSPS
jgi:serine/threonine-protein kinase